MNVLERIISISREFQAWDWSNTIIEISPEAFDMIVRESGGDLSIRDGWGEIRYAHERPLQRSLPIVEIRETDRMTGDEYEGACQGATIASGNLCRSSHERLAWRASVAGEDYPFLHQLTY